MIVAARALASPVLPPDSQGRMKSPVQFPWKKEYTVGNEFIDAQHRTLLELAELLHIAVNAGQGYKVIQNAFAALQKYTQEHFADEERFWAGSKSTTVNAHRRVHREIAEELAALRHEEEFGVVFCTPNELSNWVVHRLIAHFIEEDQGAYLGLPKPAGRAKG
ncbi:bacteriohemerythrin [Azospirillum sp. sgz302134]